MADERRDNIEVRLHKDGTLDEVVIYDPRTGHGIFHLEQMDDHWFWMRCYGITQDLVVHFGATIGLCDDRPMFDEQGKYIGHGQVEGPKVWANFEWDDPPKESETHEDLQTPAAERRTEIAKLINQYGVSCVLQEIAGIFKEGRKAEHEQELIADLIETERKYQVGDRKYWDARIAEDKDPNNI